MLNGSFTLNGRQRIQVAYSASSLRGGREDLGERFAHQDPGPQFIDPEIKAYLAQNQETVVHEDWICEFVRRIL